MRRRQKRALSADYFFGFEKSCTATTPLPLRGEDVELVLQGKRDDRARGVAASADGRRVVVRQVLPRERHVERGREHVDVHVGTEAAPGAE